MSLSLSDDVLYLVFCHLDINHILIVRQVCQRFYDISKWRSLWDTLFQGHIHRHNIPIPGRQGRPIASLSTRELERCLYRALKLRRNWLSPSPTVRRQNTFVACPSTRIISLHFLPNQSWRWLISLSMSSGAHRRFILQTWDLLASPPVCTAQRELRRLRGMAVNKSSTEQAIAIMHSNVEVLSPSLTTSTQIPETLGGVHYFSGTTLITRDTEGRIFLWDLQAPDSKLELRNPELVEPMQVLDIVTQDNFVLVLKTTTLELYHLAGDSATPTAASTFIHPVFQHKWQWRIDIAVMTIQAHPPMPARPASTPISILVRFGSFFPWSINILHHFKLYPNSSYQASDAIDQRNLPFHFPPVQIETIASPVRLHATSDIAIGPYGSAIWTDTHTEDYFDDPDRGQRLAGKYLPPTFDDEDVDQVDQVPANIATSVYAVQQTTSWVRLALDETEGKIALGSEDGHITILDYL